MDSDEDIMMVNKDITIVTDVNDCSSLIHRQEEGTDDRVLLPRKYGKPGLPLGLLSEEGATPGYARIVAVDGETYQPLTPEDHNPLTHLCDVKDGLVLFSTDKLQCRMAEAMPSRRKQGPAMTEDSTKEFKSSDLVHGLFCPSWPKSAEDWVTRNRQYDWPSEEMQGLTKRGFFLVPVSSSWNPCRTEWRISFTLTERELIWRWNVIQYKTLLVMKIVKRDLIEPVVPNTISSYHLKTLMLWMFEERPSQFWTINNFPKCIKQCLDKLIQYIQGEYCPHYFIKANNLFKNKFTLENNEKLCSLLQNFRTNFWQLVFELETLRKHSTNMDIVQRECFTDIQSASFRNISLMNEVANLRISLLISFATSAMKPALQLLSDSVTDVSIRKHRDYKKLLTRIHSDDPEQLEVIEALHRLVDVSLGSQLCAKAFQIESEQEKSTLFQECEELFLGGQSIDTSAGKLKMATFKFLKTDYSGALNLVKEVLSLERTIPLSGFEPRNPELSVTDFVQLINNTDNFVPLLRNVGALEVVFLPSEFSATLDPIKFEIIRAMSAAVDLDSDNPLRWVALDAGFYALLLQFHVCLRTDSQEALKQTLGSLRRYASTPGIPQLRRVVALNIVGHCLLLVGETQWAVDVFMGSLVLLNTYNSAAWHLTILAWREFCRIMHSN
ncbi:hypothetical protein FSP39_017860 [Pinctada imbricata]|uniref:Mab-21-like HhH/H2TH-like domain-containing protein n=1 Tax=Pinctada imbricata TaxID=66713 RepID=A0AA88Y133_PINIB|nr:hypothetical protein FSP39_017860 [Pinctada imbricata]